MENKKGIKRREFLRMTGEAIGVAALGGIDFATAAPKLGKEVEKF